MLSKRKTLLAGVVLGSLIVAAFLLALNCPTAGIAFTTRARDLHRLKNRTSLPQATDFDPRVTLDSLLETGDDTNRWSVARAAKIQGQVLDVAYAKPEATNCFNPCRRDIHIVVATEKSAPKARQVIVEVTPNLRSGAASQELSSTVGGLQEQLIGKWCEIEGWLYFDVGHAEEAENTAPGKADNWRATAWEIHPVTSIRVLWSVH